MLQKYCILTTKYFAKLVFIFHHLSLYDDKELVIILVINDFQRFKPYLRFWTARRLGDGEKATIFSQSSKSNDKFVERWSRKAINMIFITQKIMENTLLNKF